MFLFPVRQQIWAFGQTAHYSVDIVFRDGLQDDAPELILQDFDSGAGLNPMLAAKLGRNYKLALGGKCGTFISHAYILLICKTVRKFFSLGWSCFRLRRGSGALATKVTGASGRPLSFRLSSSPSGWHSYSPYNPAPWPPSRTLGAGGVTFSCLRSAACKRFPPADHTGLNEAAVRLHSPAL